MPKFTNWKGHIAGLLNVLADCVERLGGARFYKLHLEAANRWHTRGMDKISVSVGEHRLWFRASSFKAIRRARTMLHKEPATIAWIDSFAVEDVFWDIGANLGIFSLYAGKVIGMRVLAFEPASFNYALLCDNIRLNHLNDVAAYNLAFSGRSELGRLTFGDDTPGAAFATVGDEGNALQEATLVFSVDDFIARFEPPFPTHIKIDVDGHEESVLAGATRTLADPRLRSLLIEVDEDDPARPGRVDAAVGTHGFRFLAAQRSPMAPKSPSRNRRYIRA